MNMYFLLSVGAYPPQGQFQWLWLWSGTAAGRRRAGQGLYCVEINHITRMEKKKHGWFFNRWLTSQTVTDTWVHEGCQSKHPQSLTKIDLFSCLLLPQISHYLKTHVHHFIGDFGDDTFTNALQLIRQNCTDLIWFNLKYNVEWQCLFLYNLYQGYITMVICSKCLCIQFEDKEQGTHLKPCQGD